MFVWNRVALVCACGLLLSSAASAQSISKRLPTQENLSPLGLERAWWGQAVLNPRRDTIRHISVDEDVAYVQATSGALTAFDSETGQKLWATQLGQFDEPSYPAVANDNIALVVVGSAMYGLEKKTGKIAWKLILPGPCSTEPAIDDDHAYVGTLDGSLYAFSLKTIRQLHQEQRLPQWSAKTMVWRYQAGKEVTSQPLVTGRSVVFASRDASLYSVTASDRKLNYQLQTDGPIVAPITNSGSILYLASEDGTFNAINIDNGRVLWNFTSSSPIRNAAQAVARDLYITPERRGMYCINADNGQQRWWQPNLTRFVAVIGDSMFASDHDGRLVKVSRETGTITATLPLRDFTIRFINDRTDRIYLATESGLILALRQNGEEFPVFHKFPDRLPILPLIAPDATSPETSAGNSKSADNEADNKNTTN